MPALVAGKDLGVATDCHLILFKEAIDGYVLMVWAFFQAWSAGVGIFLGFPILLIAVVLYIIAVVRDIKKHDVIHD